MSIQESKSKIDGIRWICKNVIDIGSMLCTGKCTGTRRIRFNSWFYKSKLRIVEILLFTYFWWFKVPLVQIKREYGFSDRTLVDWASFCREVAVDVVFNHSEAIGGPGVIVEIDESKFGKRKYHRGKRVEGQWVFGGVERESGRCFLVPVPDRSAKTLMDLIKKWIKPGSIIISDCWKSYSTIKDHNDYSHITVNHSLEFKNSETGAHTNTIEGLWYHAKLSCPAHNRCKDHFLGYMAVFMLRKKWKLAIDSFANFMISAANLYSVTQEDLLLDPADFVSEKENDLVFE